MTTFLKINLAAPVAALLSTSALADPAPAVVEAFAAALAVLPQDGTAPAQNCHWQAGGHLEIHRR